MRSLEVENSAAAHEVIVLPGFSRVHVDRRDSRPIVASCETEFHEMDAGDWHIEPHSPLKRTRGLYAGPWVFASEEENVAGHVVAYTAAKAYPWGKGEPLHNIESRSRSYEN